MTRTEIEAEFDRFFEFDDPDNKTVVTSVSCRLFAEHIARLAIMIALQKALNNG